MDFSWFLLVFFKGPGAYWCPLEPGGTAADRAKCDCEWGSPDVQWLSDGLEKTASVRLLLRAGVTVTQNTHIS